jgi:glycosyltransferase involved in cell wall biosynthesis
MSKSANSNCRSAANSRFDMISIVIPAHNESSVITRTLRALTTGALPDELDVIVVCNGCTDDTATIARRFGAPVRVIETSLGNKTHALNLGDQVARAFPRIYVDADVVVTLSTIRALAERLEQGGVIAVAPRPYFDLTACSWLVRAFYDIRCRLPSFDEGIGGSGVYALSEIARRRFNDFPNLVADDTYVRVQFMREERETLTSVKSIVFAPHTINDLIAIEARADFGTFELARIYPELWKNKGGSNHNTLIGLFKHPLLWPRLLIYWYVRSIARRKARTRLRTNSFIWERDQTSRDAARAPDLSSPSR